MSVHTDFRTIQRTALIVGVLGLATSITMTAKFGWETSWVHAIGFACITVMAAIIYPARRFISAMGLTGVARTLTACAPFVLLLELFGDCGYTIGQRDKSIKGSNFQSAVYTDSRSTVDEDKAALAMWNERLAKLEGEKGWVATVTADGLRSQLAVLDKDIELETQRGGCKGKCLSKMDKKAGVQERIAAAEEHANIINQISATKRKLDEARGKAKDTPMGHSAAKSQTDFVAKLYLAFTGAEQKQTLNPDEGTLSFTEIFIGFFIALGCTVLPTIAFMIAFAGEEAAPIRSTRLTESNDSVTDTTIFRTRPRHLVPV